MVGLQKIPLSLMYNIHHIPMHPNVISTACQFYRTTPDQLTPLSGGHYNAVYQFPQHNSRKPKYAVLRIGKEDCPTGQTLAMLEWVLFLSQENAPVAAPLASGNGCLIENLECEGIRYVITAFEKADGILAEDIPIKQWTDGMFFDIGRATGKLHQVSLRYRPARPGLVRPNWYESSEIHEATLKLSHSSDPAKSRLLSLIDELNQLPTSHDDYGLIHADLHFANFLIQPEGKVAIIDFDDCAYGWFAMDVAMALFDVLVLYDPSTEQESQLFAHRFMSNYLSGYRQENSLSSPFLEQIPRFLKLKEICIYAELVGHPDTSSPGTWVGKFMRNRFNRIASDVPYTNIDFSSL